MSTAAPTRPDQRRSRRFRFHVDVDVSDRRGVRRGRAVDVARHGLFVAIVDPPHNRHLVQVAIHLPPPFSSTVQAAATVSRTLSGQGVGLSLFALSDDAKRRWDHFIAALQQHHHQLPSPSTTTTTPQPAQPGVPSFLLRLKTLERLKEFARTHVAVGGTVLFTPVLLPQGAPVALVVVHPKTEQEHVLLGRVHRAVSDSPKRLEILFAGVDVDRFAAFVDSGASQLPTVVGVSDSLPPVSTAAPPAPSTEPPQPSAGHFDDLDIEVVDEEMEDDPIEWDLRTSDLPVLVGKEVPATAPQRRVAAKEDDDDDDEVTVPGGGAVREESAARDRSDLFDLSVVDDAPTKPPATRAPTSSQAPTTTVPTTVPPTTSPSNADVTDPDDDDFGVGADGGHASDELLIDDTQLVRDPGLRPTPVRLSCDGARCDSDSYVVELGPCSGVLGLVADLTPFWSPTHGRVVSIPRLVEGTARRERFHTYLRRGGQIEDMLSLATFLAAADLAEAPHHPESAEPLKTSRAIERLAVAARRVADEDVVAPTKVKCPSCSDGHLVLERG